MPVCRCCHQEGEGSGTNTSIRRSTEKVLDNNERVVTDILRIVRTCQDRMSDDRVQPRNHEMAAHLFCPKNCPECLYGIVRHQ